MDKLPDLWGALLLGMAAGGLALWLRNSPAAAILLRRKPELVRVVRKGG